MNFDRDWFKFIEGKRIHLFKFNNLFNAVIYLDKLKIQCELSYKIE